MKRLSLELGGKNPQVVFADADLDAAADGVVFGICFNAGQCCVSGSRLIVEASVAARFEELLKQKFDRVVIGDPLDARTQIGAITSDAQFETIQRYIASGKAEGARLVCGGDEPDAKGGPFVRPTLFADVTRDMAIVREEIFGPVLTMTTFTGFDEAMMLANDSDYGLAASIWSTNLDNALRASQIIQAGRVWVNTTISGGPELPSGGFKQSGQGREAGIYGVEEYTNVKSTHIAFGPRSPWVS
jgi:acyl-CoA reductase-like NAD-dependent aldehyde dehydrogenase